MENRAGSLLFQINAGTLFIQAGLRNVNVWEVGLLAQVTAQSGQAN
jgi:hypothetical protein